MSAAAGASGGVKGDGTLIDSLAGTPVQPIWDSYRGQSGRLTPIRIQRSSDGLYRDGDGSDTHNPPKRLIVAETEAIGCFVRDPAPMEAAGPLPMGADERTQNNVRRIQDDIHRVAAETRDSVGWAGISYYLDRRETQVNEAYMHYGQSGLAMAREAFSGVEERAALESVRRAAAAVAIPAEVDIVTRAKLRALLRDADAFVPCRSLQPRS